MKNLKNIIYTLLLGVVLTTALTSCLSSDDNSLTDDQKKQYALMMAGNYSGQLYFYNDTLPATSSSKSKVDSVSTSMYMGSDNVLTIYDFPAELLFKQLDGHEDLKAAAKEYGTVDLKVSYLINDAQSSYVYYFVQPQTVSLTLTYGGETHNISVAFMTTYYGIYNRNGWNSVSFVEAAIYDGKDSSGNDKYLDGKALYNDNLTTDEIKDLTFQFYGKK